MNNAKPAGAFTINRNNDVTDVIPHLKAWHQTKHFTTAAEMSIIDYHYLITKELPVLRRKAEAYDKLNEIEKERQALILNV